MPAAFRPAVSESLIPSTRSIESTAAVLKLRVGPGNMDRRVAGEIAGELLHVPQLAAEIQLAADRPLELLGDRPRAVVLELGETLHQLRQPGKDVRVDRHLLARCRRAAP